MVTMLIKDARIDHQWVISVKRLWVITLHKENAVINNRQRMDNTSHIFCLFFMGSALIMIYAVQKHCNCVRNKQIPFRFGV